MHSTTAFVAFSALLSSALGLPTARNDVCGVAPTGTSSVTPLATPAGIDTAAQCQNKCDANPSCESFCFGLVNGDIKCELFGVPVPSLPALSSPNLLCYNKACTSVPKVVPTASDPTGTSPEPATTQGATPTTPATKNHPENKSQPENKNQSENKNQPRAAEQICGAAPTGTSKPTPIKTLYSVHSAQACAAKCKADPSCER